MRVELIFTILICHCGPPNCYLVSWNIYFNSFFVGLSFSTSTNIELLLPSEAYGSIFSFEKLIFDYG